MTSHIDSEARAVVLHHSGCNNLLISVSASGFENPNSNPQRGEIGFCTAVIRGSARDAQVQASGPAAASRKWESGNGICAVLLGFLHWDLRSAPCAGLRAAAVEGELRYPESKRVMGVESGGCAGGGVAVRVVHRGGNGARKGQRPHTIGGGTPGF